MIDLVDRHCSPPDKEFSQTYSIRFGRTGQLLLKSVWQVLQMRIHAQVIKLRELLMSIPENAWLVDQQHCAQVVAIIPYRKDAKNVKKLYKSLRTCFAVKIVQHLVDHYIIRKIRGGKNVR